MYTKHLCKDNKFTFFLSLIEPFPLTIILHPVSCSNCLAVIPRGPRILPTKLNCNKSKFETIFKEKHHIHILRLQVYDIKNCVLFLTAILTHVHE